MDEPQDIQDETPELKDELKTTILPLNI